MLHITSRCFSIFLLLISPTSAWADWELYVPNISLEVADPSREVRVVSRAGAGLHYGRPPQSSPLLGALEPAPDVEEKVIDREFVIVHGIMTLAIIADMESTYFCYDRNPNCYETNDFLRPMFEDSNKFHSRAKVYGFQAAMIGVTGFVSYALKKHDIRIFGMETWWVIPAYRTGRHGYLAGANISVALE